MMSVAKKLFETLDLNELANATTAPQASANTALKRYVVTVIPLVKIFSNNAYEIEEVADDKRILKVNGKYLKKYKPRLQEIRIMTT